MVRRRTLFTSCILPSSFSLCLPFRFNYERLYQQWTVDCFIIQVPISPRVIRCYPSREKLGFLSIYKATFYASLLLSVALVRRPRKARHSIWSNQIRPSKHCLMVRRKWAQIQHYLQASSSPCSPTTSHTSTLVTIVHYTCKTPTVTCEPGQWLRLGTESLNIFDILWKLLALCVTEISLS